MQRWYAMVGPQIRMTTGLDQVWVFDGKYYLVLVGLLVVWALLFLDLLIGLQRRRARWCRACRSSFA